MSKAGATQLDFSETIAPIRAELFSAERLEQHAESLAAAQTVTREPARGHPLLPRVMENGRVLLEYYRTATETLKKESTIQPAAEWLVDNFFIVEEQLREIRDDLPPGFYRKLPKLASGHLEGYPRVFGVAWAYVAHTDSRFDPELLKRFVNAYQKSQVLTCGELWAVAITLRVVLVENLRRLAEIIVRSQAARERADQFADGLLGTGGQPRFDPAILLRPFEKQPLERPFAVQLVQRLRDLDPKVGPILLWLDERLHAQGTNSDEIVRAEHQEQTAMTITVRNVITSMRLMSAFDWRGLFESVSLVDKTLRDGGNFADMDFATRDTYRHAIEELSRGSSHSEIEIAQRAVEHAKQVPEKVSTNMRENENPQSDPGHYLISGGRYDFERELGFRVPIRRRLFRMYCRQATPGYLGSILLGTLLILALPLELASEMGFSRWQLVLLGLLAAIPASDLAIALLNRAVADMLGPRTLPRLELREGIPENLRTIVVIPTLLTGLKSIEEQVERLEVHYLANPDGDIRFALLSDGMDCDTETLPNDDILLKTANRGIAELNRRHGPAPGGGKRFYLFHRRRVWNAGQQRWMGWERKRGKLHELNLHLRGSSETTFVSIDGKSPESVPGVRYVITLDSDTHLPRGAACRLVGTMAHPLNRPHYGAREGRIVDGYSLVQPRITPALPNDRGRSLFQKVFSGPGGMDPYASAVSDVYQDLFREGSYTGKGIYDLDAFEESLAGKVPENALLSHDLFEGIFARAALASDIELFEEYPSHFLVSASRQHRWARGDWQLLPWVFGIKVVARGKDHPYAIPVIGRWKMVDNLRRTLVAPAMFLTLLAGWLISPASAWAWTAFVLLMISIPALLPFLTGLKPRLGGISRRSHMRAVLSDFTVAISQIALTISFLAYQAWLMSDAIVRTLFRMCITRRNLLEWVTAAQAKAAEELDQLGVYRRMSGGILVALTAFGALCLAQPRSIIVALPLILLWGASPAIAASISKSTLIAESKQISPGDARTFRLISRQTWRFFETFVTGADHYLPPDNFQEDPAPTVAHRTSPTNIGLYLLSSIAASDFGWLGAREAAERIDATLATIRRLETFRGHLFNWYDTTDLRTLDPKYISSVDSGNLAGHLLVLADSCRSLAQKPLLDGHILAGARDSVWLLREALANSIATGRSQTARRKLLSNAALQLAELLETAPSDAWSWTVRFTRLRERARLLEDVAQSLHQEEASGQSSELQGWAGAVKACIESHIRDAEILIPQVRLQAKEYVEIFQGPVEESREWAVIAPDFETIPSFAGVSGQFGPALKKLDSLRTRAVGETPGDRDAVTRIDALSRAIADSVSEAGAAVRQMEEIARTAEKMFVEMDFTFLFDDTRKLFSIGYRGTDGSLDPSCYDLLASEARLTSFIAIAKGDVPASHWFRMGRALTPVGRDSALISWSGSMFEYLMPALVMRSPAGSMLSQTYQLVVSRQIQYGHERHVPWGVSESAFNARDLRLTYQYSSFGVPGLGLKRGLSENIVIAPYATALAAMIDPSAAIENFADIAKSGGKGAYGFYEALDFTSSRVPEGQEVAVVRAYMAHHQGMSLVALANVLLSGEMQDRFHAVPIVQATELLLQERTPRDVLVARPRAEEVSAAAHVNEIVPPVIRRFTTPHDPTPRTQLLSNGRYTVMVTAAGSGYSRWNDKAITRWREDATRDCWGSYIFLRDEQSGELWSAGHQPAGVEADSYEVEFHEDHVEFLRHDRSLATMLEIVVSSEDDAEMRRVSVTNLGGRARNIEITSFAELSLNTQAADAAHPAFSNLFVETEFVPDVGAILATRRKRSNDEDTIWAAHVLFAEGETLGDLQFETDRGRFLGRGRDLRSPEALLGGHSLSNTAGAVLDPALSLRRRVHIPPGKTAHVVFTTIAGATREKVLDLADKYRSPRAFERTLALAWTQAKVELHHLGITQDDAHLFQKLANAVLYSDSSLRPNSETLGRGHLNISTLWAQGISGDLPIVLARIDEEQDLSVIRQLLRAHEYWRLKHLSVDLLILNEKPSSYLQELQGSLEALVRGSQLRLAPNTSSGSGSIFLLRSDLLTPDARLQLQCAARVMLLSRRGSLTEQINRSRQVKTSLPSPQKRSRSSKHTDTPLPKLTLEFFNGLGGFSENGREYVTLLSEELQTPEPWVNVIANPEFGFLVSESGSGFTWSLNSRENQLTPWLNDHLMDTPGEVIYIRDEITGEVWCPTALPIRNENSEYMARHGQGYTRFLNNSHGIRLDLVQFVAPDDPIKVSRLTLQNDSTQMRRLSVTAYVEWVLGSSRSLTAPYIVTEIDGQSGAVFARNSRSSEFSERIAFADLGGLQTSCTGDRTEFLGRNRSPENPAALDRSGPLSGTVGAGLDPCAAMQTSVELRPGMKTEVVFFLGQVENRAEARQVLGRFRGADLNKVLREVTSRWDDVLKTVQVTTPDRAMDLLINRWLLYQTLSSRIWARAGFYQVSGAYGFRDQLQDVMALMITRPQLVREHLLRCAARQFHAGDVQHWWHPPSGRGVRTRISDDRLWLPYAVIQYIEATGDKQILDEEIPFLDGDELAEGQNETYFEPAVSKTRASLFEHCARALDCSLRVGEHNLPLMGTGDWNDGMNHVGQNGKGESVWLGWFLHTILWEFAKVADSRGEDERAEAWRLHVSTLKAAIEQEGWDGGWYRRAFFDDGTAIGSAANLECRIDSIAQSWGVISGAAEKGRGARAMAAVEQELVLQPEGMVLLLAPPFDHTKLDPGYIKGYVPGIRENGGQYTHAAVWTLLAFAAQGNGDKAGELFRMLNPIHHGDSRSGVQRYKVEPYVVAGDVYAEPEHIGRGGWTWYTGSAGWLYRAGIEWILGLHVRGTVLSIDPCIPRKWPCYSAVFRYHSATYRIRVENPRGISRGILLTELDGKPSNDSSNISLVDDGAEHQVRVILG